MIKNNYKKLLLCIVIFLFVFICFNFYQDKRMYERQLSQDLDNEMVRLINAIVDNEKLYKNILSSGQMTNGQVYDLHRNYNLIIEYAQKYERLAIQFGYIDRSEVTNNTAGSANAIETFVNSFKNHSVYPLKEQEESDEVVIQLSVELKEKIEQIRKLNSVWIEAADKNIAGITRLDSDVVKFDSNLFREYYGSHSISNDFWVNFVLDLDEGTMDVLSHVGVIDMRELLEE
ncbi:hypothetical protein LGQ02_12155 [Bacillus shivajii]|uniref:hypothetical protein n=1 Tax=Bacillus shivajii TaxID=1983719 RepID=UPI001CF975F9|nr:hypothetical protein [Bacillus shivajii]UCZ51618.1 hypothetical protein LGQ02_12155 [Bacillus shivajii]